MTDVCFCVQCTHSDLLDSAFRPEGAGDFSADDPALYAVGPLQAAGLGPIVLTAPDLAENRQALPALAEQWGVDLVLADEFNVVRRLLTAAERHGASVVARVVMASSYVEPDLVGAQVRLLQDRGADYCALPRDVNVNFGADVVTVAALERFDKLVDDWDETRRSLARYRPWPFLEQMADEFDVVFCDQSPAAGAERVNAIREHPNWPERAGPGIEGGEYRALAGDYLTGTETILDAGCGHGEITNILSEFAGSAVGVDYDFDMVAIARERFPSCEFERADLQQWSRPDAFDVIFHCHTLEHCPDPVAVLSNLRGSLKPGGRLIVEVPLELRPGVINPHHHREYSVAELLSQLHEAGLEVQEERGVSRGIYGRGDQAREAYLTVCTATQRSDR
jgi:SAM-dependent methyltransferase